MEMFLAAKHLIFAEGSAFHLCNLAGRNFETIDIIVRRKDSEIGSNFLVPRAKSVQFRNLVAGEVYPILSNNRFQRNKGITILNETALLDFLGSVKLDISQYWNSGVYNEKVLKDSKTWLRNLIDRASPATFENLDAIKDSMCAAMAELPQTMQRRFLRWADRLS